MDNALPHPAPHHHGHAHHHDHTHNHDHAHHHDIPTPAVARGGGFSLIALSSAARLALAVPPVVMLWLLTAWAMHNG
jgi:hypothetical protein